VPHSASQAFRKFIEIVLFLSHGQATVEQEFSLNKALLVEKQLERSLVALRVIRDYNPKQVRFRRWELTLSLHETLTKNAKALPKSTIAKLAESKKKKTEVLAEKERERKRLRLEHDTLGDEIKCLKR
jgi:hypothetical protein